MTDVQGLVGPVTFVWPVAEQRCCHCDKERAMNDSGFCAKYLPNVRGETRTDA
jgi:hypothetical protein